MVKKNNFKDGLLMCSKYAFMPNKLQYCGGNHNDIIFELTALQKDAEYLNPLLKEFQTLYPYLKLIAKNNKIKDPFDCRVVEAYWIGNELLEKVNIREFYNHFQDGLQLKRKMTTVQFEKITNKLSNGALPHHSYHVFNIWLRTGKVAVEHTLKTMDQCRIGWGQVKKITSREVEVMAPLLIYKKNKLDLSKPEKINLTYKMFGESFVRDLNVDDWVSYHWHWVCDKLELKQVENLKKYTEYCLNLANANSG